MNYLSIHFPLLTHKGAAGSHPCHRCDIDVQNELVTLWATLEMLFWPLLLILHPSWEKLIRRRWIKICSPSQRAASTPNFNRSVSDMLCESEEWGTSLEEPQWSTESLFNKSKIDLFFFFNSDPPSIQKQNPVTHRCLICSFLPMTDVFISKWEHLDISPAFCFAGVAFFLQHRSPVGGMFGVTKVTRGGGGSNLDREWWEVIHVGKEEAGSSTRAPNDTTDAHLLLFSPVSSKNTLISGYAKSFF